MAPRAVTVRHELSEDEEDLQNEEEQAQVWLTTGCKDIGLQMHEFFHTIGGC